MTEEEKIPCLRHEKKGYKKGCPDCFDMNRPKEIQDEPDYPPDFNNWDH